MLLLRHICCIDIEVWVKPPTQSRVTKVRWQITDSRCKDDLVRPYILVDFQVCLLNISHFASNTLPIPYASHIFSSSCVGGSMHLSCSPIARCIITQNRAERTTQWFEARSSTKSA
jgi:hypothetical protein